MAGLQVACEAHIQGGKVLGHPPWEFRPSYTDYIPGTLDFLCRLPLLGHSYILSPFHPHLAVSGSGPQSLPNMVMRLYQKGSDDVHTS